MIRRRFAVPVALALLAAAAAARPLLADVDIMVGNGNVVTGTLSPADEIETVRVTVPAGAKLSISVVGRKAKGGGPAPTATFRVLDPDGGEAAPLQPTKRTGASLRGLVAQRSGAYAVEVRGDGARTGEYVLKVTWTSPKKFTFSRDLSEGAFEVPFAADPGARATFLVKSGKGAGATPRLDRITEDDGPFEFPFPAPRDGASQHKAANVLLPVGGDLRLAVSDAGAGGGAVSGTITIRPPKPKKRSVVLTDAKIGDAAGERSALGVVLGPDGGLLLVDGTDLAIEGASIEVPEGAVGLPTAFVVANSPDIAPPAGTSQAGPAVFFGPEGITFPAGKPALVTIPFDPGLADGDAGRVVVAVRDAKGKVKTLTFSPPYPLVDLGLGLVTFPVAHFSSYQAFVTPGAGPVRGDLDGDGFADLVISAEAANGNVGKVFVFRGGPQFQSANSSAADAIYGGGPADDEFGRATLVADLNGDGQDDLAVSARQPHRVSIWFGGPGFTDGGPADVTLTGTGDDPNFGITLAAGDVGGSSALDLIVGDESNSRADGERGGAFVFFGPVTANTNADAAGVVITGETIGDLFGAAVAAGNVLPPVSGPDDGRADLIVGADQADNPGEGRVYVYRAPVAPGTLTAANADVILSGVASGDGFGLALATGDVDGAGRDDLIVGAMEFDPTAPLTNAGRAYVFRGEAGLVTGSATAAQVVLTGSFAGDLFGGPILVGDVSGDAKPEILAGAVGWSQPSAGAGAVGIFSTFADTQLLSASRIEGRSAGAGAAWVLPPADVNGDGRLDVLVGSPGDSAGGADAGAVFVFFGRSAAFGSPVGAASADVIITGAAGEKLGGPLD